ncbi:MAG: SH3 domain-containing protein [Pseudomonadota bacterium]
MRRFIIAASAALLATTLHANASPGIELVCYDRDFQASIGFEDDWSRAYITASGAGEIIIPSSGDAGSSTFEFSGNNWRLAGLLPEAQLFKPDGSTANCYQSKENIKTLTFYGEQMPFTWSAYAADGMGSGNVRAAPSILSEKIASLGDGEPVIILSNTDVFLDGYFWFKIEYGERERERGYIWGALLCRSTDDEFELSSTVRKCN